MRPILFAENLRKHYGGVHALRNGCFDLRAGEIHALIGENGAGKSTLARIIAGATRPDGGRILIDGQEVSFAGPVDAQRRGVAIVFQELDLFPHLSVAENVVIGNARFRSGPFAGARAMEAFCGPYLQLSGLSVNPRRLAGDLSVAQSQLLALARALSMEPRVLLMDEPTSALFDDAAEHLFAVIGGLKSRGMAIVYVSHKMEEIFRISDRITVLRDGATIGTSATAETNLNEIVAMMAGRSLEEVARHAATTRGAVVLSVSGLTTAKLTDVSFDLHRGEVLGVAGLVGAGRTELGKALFGIDRLSAGTIRLNGGVIRPRSPRQAIAAGIGLVPEDRKGEGLMMRMSVLDNSVMAVQSRLHGSGLIRRQRELDAVKPVLNGLSLRFGSYGSPVGNLSGGNQQKVLLARWLLADPQVLFLDDPTRGIDIGAKQDVYRIIRELAAMGKGIIFVSSELPELLRCSDRILVMKDGRVAAIVDASGASQEAIIAAATLVRPTAPQDHDAR